MNRKRSPVSSPVNTKVRMFFILVSAALLVAVLGGFYLRFAWNRYQQLEEGEALRLAQSVESLLHADHIAALGSGDAAASDDHLVEQSLVHLVESTDLIYYAYILKPQDGDVFIAADSSAADSGTFAATRRISEEMSKINRIPFETGRSFLAGAAADPTGDWIRALAPIHGEGKDVIAAIGLSYSAADWQANMWKKMAPDFIIVACLLIVVIIFFILLHKQSALKEFSKRLAFQEALYRSILEQAPIGIILQGNRGNPAEVEYISVNPVGEAILGRTAGDLKKISWTEMTHADDIESELPQYKRFQKGEINSYSMEKRLIRPDRSVVWVNFSLAGVSGSLMYDSVYIYLIEDISGRKLSEKALQESERSKSVFLSHIPGMAYRCKNDRDWTMEFVSEGCHELTGYTAESLILNREISYNEIISPEYRDILRTEWERTLPQHRRFHYEYEIITKSGERKWVLEMGQGVCDTYGNVEALEGIVLDISERKKTEHQVTYLREHDTLTNLYNRNRLEKEKSDLDRPEFWPLSIVICDIDGLRMINDAYSHEEGDLLIVKTAGLIRGCLRGKYVMSHVGGGKFVLLLPNTDSQTAHRLKTEIQNTIGNHNKTNTNALYTINISIGHSTKETEDQKILDVTRAAEEYLDRRKLLNQNSSHSAIVSAIMSTLYAKSQETERHGQRLGQICRIIGAALALKQQDLDDLQLLSKLHDIGKIGIDDHILNKPGKLDENEWKIMKQHPEIGYRIAISTPQLEHIANYILSHHERWDGKGYPMGLKGQDIPLVSRILSIADAFDAMTEDRIYHKALPHEAAIQEIERNAGSQFDPDIAMLFVKLIAKQENLDLLTNKE